MLIEPEVNAQIFYPALMSIGFRRSGEQVYRPNCPQCNACQSLRIDCSSFNLSKGQKRLLNKNKHFTTALSRQVKPHYFLLYERYINHIHRDGSMYPACQNQFNDFIKCHWGDVIFIEIYDKDKLIAISVTDQLITENTRAWSAFYCFYDPDYRAQSLGKYAILQQIKIALSKKIEFLYLGYYIRDCQKMNYKNQFNPHQRFINQQWVKFD